MIDSFFSLIILLVVVGILIAVVVYVADNLLPDPIGRIVKVGAIVVAALVVVMALLQMIGVSTGVTLP